MDQIKNIIIVTYMKEILIISNKYYKKLQLGGGMFDSYFSKGIPGLANAKLFNKHFYRQMFLPSVKVPCYSDT